MATKTERIDILRAQIKDAQREITNLQGEIRAENLAAKTPAVGLCAKWKGGAGIITEICPSANPNYPTQIGLMTHNGIKPRSTVKIASQITLISEDEMVAWIAKRGHTSLYAYLP